MDEARLAEIEDIFAKLSPEPPLDAAFLSHGEWVALEDAARAAQQELIAEVRRLQALVDAYEMGHRVPVGRAYGIPQD